LRIKVGCRLGLVRRRTAQHVSALYTTSESLKNSQVCTWLQERE
jgi:hypothetical protein